MAPELLNPPQFNLTHSNPSKESDVFSFAMTTYEVFCSYLVARATNRRLPPTARSSRGSRHTVQGRRPLSPLTSCLGSGRLVQLTQPPTSGYPIRYGTSSNTAGIGFHNLGCPLDRCIKRSLIQDRNQTGTSRSLRTVKVSIVGCGRLVNILKPIFRYGDNEYQRCSDLTS